ncbi:hypothetical protein [Deinococcus sp.]|uniref:hypothetical protein n=1 Tax=Deinococcus sp. TaxID=47478 RepID=UPI003C7BF8A9
MKTKGVRVPTEALLKAAQQIAQNMSALSKDPKVREEALNVGKAVGKLLQAIRESQTRSK